MAQRRSMHRRNPSVDMPKYSPQVQGALGDVQNQLQSSHLAQISDYDSDIPGYISDYPSRPPPPTRTKADLNLSVLQRYNNEVASITSVAPYAVIYQFTPLPEPAWSKTGVEGSLFLCQLTPGPYGEERYVAIVLNRRGLDNWEAPLIEGENAGIEITDEYVIVSYKQEHEQKIYGVFIFSEGPGTSTAFTRESNAIAMKELATVASTSLQKAEAAAAEARARHTNGHVQEAEGALDDQNMGAPMGRQISLQQLFGQQRAQDASFSARSHNMDGAFEEATAPSLLAPSAQSHQPDPIADLLRKAGIGMR